MLDQKAGQVQEVKQRGKDGNVNMKIEGFKPHLMYKANSIKMSASPCAHRNLKAKGYNHNQQKKMIFSNK